MIHVIVVGTNPPCPRCDLVKVRAEDLIRKMGLEADVSHVAWDSEEAEALSKMLGYSFGTATQVSQVSGVPVNQAKKMEASILMGEKTDGSARPADLWVPELDEAMNAVAESAPGAGFLMTPVFLIDQKVYSQGSVPSMDELQSFLEQAAAK